MLALALSAELTGVTDLRPLDTEDSPFHYTFKVQCTSCRETHPNFVTMTRHEMNEMSGSRGEANFVWKCKNCKVIFAPLQPQSSIEMREKDAEANRGYSVSTRPISRRRPRHTSRAILRRLRIFLSLTAGGWNSLSSRLRYGTLERGHSGGRGAD